MESNKTRYFDALNTQFNNFTSIEFVRKASNLIEKFIWMFIAVAGTIWIGKMLYVQLLVMEDFPVVKSKETSNLLNMTYPAVTFCPKMTSKLALIEGLGNYLDLNKGIPPEAFVIRNEYIKTNWQNRIKKVGCDMAWSTSETNSLANYYHNCCNRKKFCEVYGLLHNYICTLYIKGIGIVGLINV